MKKIKFTFPYKPHPALRKKNIPKNQILQLYPFVPVRFYHKGKKTNIIEALLDSGADAVHINSSIASYLNLPKGKKSKLGGAGGTYISYETKIGFVLGRGGNFVDFGYVKCFYPQNQDVPILIGRCPVFEEYQVIFEEFEDSKNIHKKKFKLIPKEDILKNK